MKWVIAILAAILVLSNGFWIYQLVDVGVTISYRNKELADNIRARDHLLAVLPGLAAGKSKPEIVRIVSEHSSSKSFEKDGCVWIGSIGLKFSQDGQLISASKRWNTGESDPCFPAF